MEIDIRTGITEEVDCIRVASCMPDGGSQVELICKYSPEQENSTIYFLDSMSCDCMYIFDKKHALDVIKGINKAIELGWLK